MLVCLKSCLQTGNRKRKASQEIGCAAHIEVDLRHCVFQPWRYVTENEAANVSRTPNQNTVTPTSSHFTFARITYVILYV
jgi:hypothetical protein